MLIASLYDIKEPKFSIITFYNPRAGKENVMGV